MEEQLDIFDEQMDWIGTAPVHSHQSSSSVQPDAAGPLRVHGCAVLYFQQRAHTKADFPDYYDLACGGHIGAGECPDKAVLREVWEETGLRLASGQLTKLGQYRAPDLHLPGFFDRETSNVYVLRQDTPPFAPGEEVARMICVRAEEFCRMELENAREIEAKTLDGVPFRISRDAWCCHDGEFAAFVFPYLKQAFPQLRCAGD